MTIELTAANGQGARHPQSGAAVATSTGPEPAEPEVAGSGLTGSELVGVSTPGLADLVVEHTMVVRRAEAAVLTLAGEWADRHPVLHPRARLSRSREAEAARYGTQLHDLDAVVDGRGDGPVGTGGVGTPEVSVFAIAEFAVLRQTSIGSGHALIADALDLRHRLPRVHAHTLAGLIPLGLARRTARDTRQLSPEQAAEVDAWLGEVGPGLSWGRYCTVLEAAVIDADPARAAERARAAARAQEVCSRGEPEGLATVFARIDAGDAAILMAMVGRLADILHARTGDTWTAGQRRAKAFGLLGRPLQALALLTAAHRPTDSEVPLDPHPDLDPDLAPEADMSEGQGPEPSWEQEPPLAPESEPESSSPWPGLADEQPAPPRSEPPTELQPSGERQTTQQPGRRIAPLSAPPPTRPSKPLSEQQPDASTQPTTPEPGGEWLRADPERPDEPPTAPPPRPHPDRPAGQAVLDRPRTLGPPEAPEPHPARLESGQAEARRPGPGGDDLPAPSSAPLADQPERHTLAGQDPPEEPEPLGDHLLDEGWPADPHALGDPGALEHDLTALRDAISTAGMAIEQWILNAWTAGAPKTELVFHLADHPGLVRTEHLGGPLTIDQLTDGLALTGAQVNVRPVIDPATEAAIDSYELSPRLRRALRTREPASVFPWSASTSPRMDADHTQPYQWDATGTAPAVPGQTGMHNAGPLARREHRVRTHGRFAVCQPVPGHYLWRTPTGHHYLITHTGTTALGRGPDAQQLWTDTTQHEDDDTQPDGDPS